MERDSTYQFGPFCLDAGEGVLLREGHLVPLTPKALSTLLVLVRNRGHVVEKDVLMEQVWPGQFVEEGNLTQHISTLRKALGENPDYIETVPRRGYRFLEPAHFDQRSAKNSGKNSQAYQAYLMGRYEWSKHTREGLHRAIVHFRHAIELDSNYVLAYAAIVDCYLRLATNYFPSADDPTHTAAASRKVETGDVLPRDVTAAIEIRCEWDRKAVERESRRAREFKTNYPGARQWQAACLFALNLFHKSVQLNSHSDAAAGRELGMIAKTQSPAAPPYANLTHDEEIQIFCIVAREQMLAGNYEAASAVLKRWWSFNEWPKLEGLSLESSADLLITAGAVAGCVASASQVPRGQKYAEGLISGAIGVSEQLGSKTRSAEGRLELALCYYREGTFDLARKILLDTPAAFLEDGLELKSITLILLAFVERYAGRLHDSLERLNEAAETINVFGPWATAFYHLELATTLRSLSAAETGQDYFEQAFEHQQKALEMLEAIGHHRCAAVAENSYGALFLAVGKLDEAEVHIARARRLYDCLADEVRRAQTDDTLARLHLASGKFDLAWEAAVQAVQTLETSGHEAFLAASLMTQGLVLCKLGRHREAKRILHRAQQIAARCGDDESVAVALMTLIEEMAEQLDDHERMDLVNQVDLLLAKSKKPSTLERLRRCHDLIARQGATQTLG